MKKLFLVILVLSIIYPLSILMSKDIKIPNFPKGTLKILQGDKELEIPIEIADTPELWSFGLMYRKDIPWDYGMLFVFETDERGAFWMKNTFIPLDIAFIDSKGKIFNIQRMLPCEDDECPIYTSPKPYRYALEVKAGFFEKFGFKEESSIKYYLLLTLPYSIYYNYYRRGSSSVGRASASQAEGRGFEPRFPLQFFVPT